MSGAVSVIIPVYNAGAWLEECLRSVAAQALPPGVGMEVIVADDASTDDSREVFERIVGADTRFRLLRSAENRGVAAMRNAALDAARGEYVAFVDADDTLAPGALAAMWGALAETGADIAAGLHTEWSADACGIGRSGSGMRVMSGMEGAVRMLHQNSPGIGLHCSPWGKLFRISALRGLRFPEGRIYEDLHTIPEAFARSRRIVCLPTTVYRYRTRPESLSHVAATAYPDALLACLHLRHVARRGVAKENEALLAAADDRLFSAVCNLLMRRRRGASSGRRVRRRALRLLRLLLPLQCRAVLSMSGTPLPRRATRLRPRALAGLLAAPLFIVRGRFV